MHALVLALGRALDSGVIRARIAIVTLDRLAGEWLVCAPSAALLRASRHRVLGANVAIVAIVRRGAWMLGAARLTGLRGAEHTVPAARRAILIRAVIAAHGAAAVSGAAQGGLDGRAASVAGRR